MKYEWKITGVNPIWISALLTGAFLVVCATGGDNLHWGYLGFEVIFPFYMSVVIGEWCPTRTDPMFEVISAQGKSVFGWIIRRFLLLFCMVTIFAMIGIGGVVLLKQNMFALELFLTFLPTAFLLSSISTFVSILVGVPHISTMVSGVIWLFAIMTMSLLRFAPVRYFYLFVRYAGINGVIGLANKFVLFFVGIALWAAIYLICRNRTWR